MVLLAYPSSLMPSIKNAVATSASDKPFLGTSVMKILLVLDSAIVNMVYKFVLTVLCGQKAVVT